MFKRRLRFVDEMMYEGISRLIEREGMLNRPKVLSLLFCGSIAAELFVARAQPTLSDWSVKVTNEAASLRSEMRRENRDTTAFLNQIAIVRALRFANADTEEAKALKPYVDREFDAATTAAIQGRVDDAQFRIDAVLHVLDGGGRRVDIEIESEPTQARANVLFFSGEVARDVVTLGTAQQLAIGEYTLRVTKPGYLDAGTGLNLVAESIARVVCTLVREELRATEQSSCRKF